MPELPEVESITRTLNRALRKKRITSVDVQAASAEDAERLVRERYRAGEIVLGGDDCVERSITAIADIRRGDLLG